jgi:hypothetical protein
MKPWESWLSHLSTLAVSISGLAYLWMKYFVENTDPFSVLNHPWQGTMLSLHVVSAPLFVFVTGIIVHSHVGKKLRSGRPSNRKTGIASMVSLPLMIASGYLLQVAATTGLLNAVLVIHLASSGVFLVTYVAHQLITFRLKRPAVEREQASFSPRQTA